MKKEAGVVIYSPSDLIRYLASPFASWLDRCYLEDPNTVVPDEESDDQQLLAQTGDEHEASVLAEFNASTRELVKVPKENFKEARTKTLAAIAARAPPACLIFPISLTGKAKCRRNTRSSKCFMSSSRLGHNQRFC